MSTKQEEARATAAAGAAAGALLATRAVLVLIALAALSLPAPASGLVHSSLTPENFNAWVGREDAAALVVFYAPWCAHCAKLKPEWEAAAALVDKRSDVVMAQMDADEYSDFVRDPFRVQGFPTIRWFPKGSQEPIDYQGKRTTEDLLSFINNQMGLNLLARPREKFVVPLDDSSFDRVVKDPSKNVLVDFYSPECGHCQKLEPIFERAALAFDGEDDVVFASYDADKFTAKGSQYGISGFPTLLWFPKTDKSGESYSGARKTDKDLIAFVNERTGAERTAGGGFSASAGRTPSLDVLAARFGAAVRAKRGGETLAALLEEVKAAAASVEAEGSAAFKNAAWASLYAKSAERILERGIEYARTEVNRLQRVARASGVTLDQRARFARRQNVLRAFQERPPRIREPKKGPTASERKADTNADHAAPLHDEL